MQYCHQILKNTSWQDVQEKIVLADLLCNFQEYISKIVLIYKRFAHL